MPKVRIVTPPSFGLICDAARPSQEPIVAQKPKDYLHTGLGQRFVAMIGEMAALAHLNLSDSDEEPPKPIGVEPQSVEIPRENRPKINVPGPKRARRRRRNRIKRTWKTSHATWTGEPQVDPYSILERDSAIQRNQFLSELSQLKPDRERRVLVVKRKEKQKEPLTRYSSSSSSSSREEAPIPQPKKKPVPTRVKAPSPPKAPVEEPEVVPAKEPKLVHVPTLITPEMVQWLRNSGMFSIKPKSQVAWTSEEQLQTL